MDRAEAIFGAILGCAVGDALGLPYEGLSARRGLRLFGHPTTYHFIAQHGMVSDDTDHTCMVAQALCGAPHDAKKFGDIFGWRLRWWLLGVPVGIGLATLKATLKLWLGLSPARSGVYSAGNGPAMRSAVLGAAIDDIDQLCALTRVSTRITHTDPKAELGALAVALAAWSSRRGLIDSEQFLVRFHQAAGSSITSEFDKLLHEVVASVKSCESTSEFAIRLGCKRGVSGYIYRTVPVVLHSWLTHPQDYSRAVISVIMCGGDTDTTAAIVGAIVGAGVGRNGIPANWIHKLRAWPKSVKWMEQLSLATAEAIDQNCPVRPPRFFFPAILFRNLIFFMGVLWHIARRCLPPY